MQEEISSPLSAQILDFCESELFQETLQNSEVASNSNCCYDQEHSSYTANANHHLLQEMNQFTTTNTATPPNSSIIVKDENPETTPPPPPITASAINQSNLSVVFDSSDDIDNDISVSLDFSTHPIASSTFAIPQYLMTTTATNNNSNNNCTTNNFDYSSLLPQYPNDSALVQQFMTTPPPPLLAALPHPPPPSVYDQEECLSAVPSYIRHINNNNTSTTNTGAASSSPSSSLLDPIGHFLHGNNLTAVLTSSSLDNPGIFNGGTNFSNMYMGGGDHHLPPHQELDFQGESIGMFCPETLHRAAAAAYNCTNELQVCMYVCMYCFLGMV